MRQTIGIAGTGAWGRALAHVARSAGHGVQPWSRHGETGGGLAHCAALIVAVPAQAVRQVLGTIGPRLAGTAAIILAAKGIEQSTGKFMHEVAAEAAPGHPLLVLSGPSFAGDVVAGLPTAVVMAGRDLAEADRWAAALGTPGFRIYRSADVTGVEIGGALKNVLAIACGIADGRGLGDSARAALTTRGFAELLRFGRKLGAAPETLMGLSGLGDLLLTCSSRQSRNYSFGFAIGQGSGVAAALAAASGVVEGAFTVQVAHRLARSHGVDMPIVDAVHAVVDGGAGPGEVIAGLLARPAGHETR